MKLGFLYAHARRDQTFLWRISLVLLAAALGLICFYGRFLYNAFAGPTPIAASPSWLHDFVRVQGPFRDTGWVQNTKLKYHGIALHESKSAEFVTASVNGKTLLVRVPNEFHGDVVEGRLVDLPASLHDAIEGDAYPGLVEADHDYRSGQWLCVILLGGFLALAVAVFVEALRTIGHVEKHAAFVKLAATGSLDDRVNDIERTLDESDRVGTWWVHPRWVVWTQPVLRIVSTDDLAAVAYKQTQKANAKPTHEMLVWRRDEKTVDATRVKEEDATTILAKLSATIPWAVVDDAVDFEKKWAANREMEWTRTQARRSTGGRS